MKVFPQNINSQDTIYASILINAKAHALLRKYMHCEDKENIEFANGKVAMFKQGYGWYRLLPLKTHNSIENVKFALATIRRFVKAQEEATENEIKALMPLMLDPSIKPSAHVAEVGYQFTGSMQPNQQQAPSAHKLTGYGMNKLQKLASKFGTNLKTA